MRGILLVLKEFYISSMQDNIKVSGVFTLKCYRADGTLKWELKTPNTIMSAGKAALANLAGNVSSPTAFTYLAVGTSTTAVAVNQTALGAEITTGGLARASATVSRVTTTVTNDTLRLEYTWTSSATHAVEEIGIFNAASAGDMLARALTTTKNVISSETLKATYDVTFA